MILDPKIPAKIAQLEKTYDALRYRTIESLGVEIAETREHFRAVPEGLDWRSVHLGEQWGKDWGSAWFRATATMPYEMEGQTVFLRAATGGPEAMLFVDGTIRGSFDPNHPVRVLLPEARAGQTVRDRPGGVRGAQLPRRPSRAHRRVGGRRRVRAARGPEVRRAGAGDGAAGRERVRLRPADPAAARRLAGPEQPAAGGDHARLRRDLPPRVGAARGDGRADLARGAGSRTGRHGPPARPEERADDALDGRSSGTRTSTRRGCGPSRETWRKIGRTYSSVLALMDGYPEFRFTQSAAYHYEKCRELYPEVFSRVVERVKEGRWEVNGAMYIEPDCNIPSGESFARQCLVGQRSYREMFGSTTDALWQPDVFGYSAALPQILRSAGVRYFLTTKLGWNDTNRFPVRQLLVAGAGRDEGARALQRDAGRDRPGEAHPAVERRAAQGRAGPAARGVRLGRRRGRADGGDDRDGAALRGPGGLSARGVHVDLRVHGGDGGGA